jgi:hypothetical protein
VVVVVLLVVVTVMVVDVIVIVGMVFVLVSVESRKWAVGSGKRSVVNGQWEVGNGYTWFRQPCPQFQSFLCFPTNALQPLFQLPVRVFLLAYIVREICKQ